MSILPHYQLLLAGAGGGGGGGAGPGALLHFNGANNSTTFTDETGKAWNAVSGAKISTAQSKFGGASMLLNGSSDFISTPSHADFNFGTGDFTIECFVYQVVQTGDQALFGCVSGSGIEVSAGLQNGKMFCGRNGVSYGPIASSAVAASTWTHVAAARQGTTMRVFHGGTLMASGSDSNDYIAAISNIGAASLNGNTTRSAYYNGYIDEFRITKGTALYTANFTPPASPFLP
jgi:hypothetical protein